MLHFATTLPGHVSLAERILHTLGDGIDAMRRRIEQRRRRRMFLNLAELDDRLLDDIGVTRAEVYTAAELPLEMNASLELRRMAAERRSREARRPRR